MGSKYQQIEVERAKPMKEILLELFAQYGNVTQVAAALGVSQWTVSIWLIRCGLQIKSVLVERKLA